ncbi:MAG: hypothetical protein M3209_09710 [Acidobacteriota bacterium]|nr:hypothetical protein [Acidobacteriota bacterium]
MTQTTNLTESRRLARQAVEKHYGYVSTLPKTGDKRTSERQIIDCQNCGVNPAIRGEQNNQCGYCFSKNQNNGPLKTDYSFSAFTGSGRREIALLEQEVTEGDQKPIVNFHISVSEIWKARLIFFGLAIALIIAAFVVWQFIRL